MDIIDDVAAAPGPLVCPSRSARPWPVLGAALGPEIVLPNLTLKLLINNNNFAENK